MHILNLSLSLSVLVLSLAFGAYFFFRWLRDPMHNRTLLWWGFGFGVLFLFKIPGSLANSGFNIVQTDFYPFFYITFSLYFAGFVSFACGLSSIAPLLQKRPVRMFYWISLAACAAYFYPTFFVPGFDTSYAPVWATNILFFLPIQILIFFALFRVAQTSQDEEIPSLPKLGLASVLLSMMLFILTSILYVVVQVTPYPLFLWYSTVINSSAIPAIQILATILLFIGLRILGGAAERK